MSPLQAFLLTVVVAVAAKSAAWFWQLRTRNAGMVDAVWTFTLGVLALFYAAVGTAPPAARALLAAMAGLWSFRLGAYLWRRNFGKPEDFRYAQFRARWGAHADRNMFWFFQFQNLAALSLSASAFLPVAYRPDVPSAAVLAAAAAIWLAAVVGEGVADGQMKRFRENPANRGQVCRDGLWRYSRHPNYFFECVHWLAYVPLAWGAPYGWVSLLAPAFMAVLLLRFSGVPLLEAEMAKRKPGYAEYMRTTSALIPWPPR